MKGVGFLVQLSYYQFSGRHFSMEIVHIQEHKIFLPSHSGCHGNKDVIQTLTDNGGNM
jgi:hypothetical protein